MSSHPPDDITRAAIAVAQALAGLPYAIVGGAACLLLGAERTTTDVDVVVPAGGIVSARSRLAKAPGFVVHKQTRHTVYAGSVDIELLSPPGMFRAPFDANHEVWEVARGGVGIRVLHPLALLNAKCGSVVQRGDAKRQSDYGDIVFLLRWLVAHDIFPTRDKVPNATGARARELVAMFGFGEEQWVAAGFDFSKGESFTTRRCRRP